MSWALRLGEKGKTSYTKMHQPSAVAGLRGFIAIRQADGCEEGSHQWL